MGGSYLSGACEMFLDLFGKRGHSVRLMSGIEYDTLNWFLLVLSRSGAKQLHLLKGISTDHPICTKSAEFPVATLYDS